MISLTVPFTEEKIRALKVGDPVELSGIVFTGRDVVHKYLHEGGKLPPEVNLRDGMIYHCGPVVVKDESGNWKVTAAGPTTSIREEPYQWQIIRVISACGESSAKAEWVTKRPLHVKSMAASTCTASAAQHRSWQNA